MWIIDSDYVTYCMFMCEILCVLVSVYFMYMQCGKVCKFLKALWPVVGISSCMMCPSILINFCHLAVNKLFMIYDKFVILSNSVEGTNTISDTVQHFMRESDDWSLTLVVTFVALSAVCMIYCYIILPLARKLSPTLCICASCNSLAAAAIPPSSVFNRTLTSSS